MLRTRPCPAIVAVFAVAGMLLAAPASAADLTIPSGPRTAPYPVFNAASSAASRDLRAAVPAPVDPGKLLIVQPARSKKHDKGRARKIRTYNLFHDPLFRLSGAMDGKVSPGSRTDAATPVALAGLGTGFGHGIGVTPGMLDRTSPAPLRTRLLKVEAQESDGLEFGCTEKAFVADPNRLGVSACYRSNLDKSWRTQTFLMKGIADGGRDWGGGLSVSYAH